MFVNQNVNPDVTDQELIQKYKDSGNLDFLGELYNRYMHLVFGIGLKYLKNEAESEDAVIQIFEKLIKSLAETDVTNFPGWLSVIARNHCLMILRARKEFTDINQQDFVESGYVLHPNDENPIEEDLEMLKAAIQDLPEEQQMCIKLFYLEKKSYKEVEDLTEYDPKNIKSFIQNGRRNIKLYFERKKK